MYGSCRDVDTGKIGNQNNFIGVRILWKTLLKKKKRRLIWVGRAWRKEVSPLRTVLENAHRGGKNHWNTQYRGRQSKRGLKPLEDWKEISL